MPDPPVTDRDAPASPLPPVVHPAGLAEHLAYAHGLGANVLNVTDQDVLELAHQQRHDGFGVGADHPRDHGHDQRWVQVTAPDLSPPTRGRRTE